MLSVFALAQGAPSNGMYFLLFPRAINRRPRTSPPVN